MSNDTTVCNMKKESSLAKLIPENYLIVWDECTVAHKRVIE